MSNLIYWVAAGVMHGTFPCITFALRMDWDLKLYDRKADWEVRSNMVQTTAIPRATLIEVKVKNPKYPSDKNLDIFCLAHTASILKMDEMMLVLVVVVVVVVATRNSGVSEYSSWKLS